MTNKLNVGFLGTNVLTMEQLRKSIKSLKGDTIKEFVCYFYHSIPVMKLTMLDEEIREYLLYFLFLMQYALEKQLTLPDALFI